MDGLIYVVGGGDGKDWLCSAEVHTPTHYWSPRSIPWKCQNTWILKVYDPKKNVWRSIADLSAKRWKCGLGNDLADAHFSMILVFFLILYILLYVLIVSVELGGFLYAVGGMDSPRAGFWGAPLNTGHLILY